VDTTKATDSAESAKPNANEPLDPLRRVFVPIEKRMLNGQMTFRTTDQTQYFCDDKGVIKRRFAKVNGKRAKKSRQKQRKAAAI
jgi:hypothetical protein